MADTDSRKACDVTWNPRISPRKSFSFPRIFRYGCQKFNKPPHSFLYFPRGHLASPRAPWFCGFGTRLLTLPYTSKSHTIYPTSCNNPHPPPPQDIWITHSTVKLCDNGYFWIIIFRIYIFGTSVRRSHAYKMTAKEKQSEPGNKVAESRIDYAPRWNSRVSNGLP